MKKYTLEQYNKSISLKKQGLGSQRISKILNIPRPTIENWINKKTKPYYFSEKRIAACNSKENIKKLRKLNKITQPKAVEAARIKNTKPIKNKDTTKELCYVLGVILGDGNASQRRAILSATDKDFVETFQINLEKWSEYKTTFNKRYIKPDKKIKRRKLQWFCYLDSIKIEKFINSFDYNKIKEKHHKINIIKGFFDSEGHFSKSYELIAYNTNYEILNLISKLLTDLNLTNQIKAYTVKNINKEDIQYYYLKILGKARYLFYQTIGFSIRRKQEKLENWAQKVGSRKYGGN